jgi:putative ABC transport system permease protein
VNIKWALLNVLRNRRRSLVTGLSILFGFAGLVLLSGYVHRVERFLMVNTVYLNHSGHIQIFKKDGLTKYLSDPKSFILSATEIETIKNHFQKWAPDIELISPYLLSNGIAQNENLTLPFQAVGIPTETSKFANEHEQVKRWSPELSEGQKVLNPQSAGEPGQSDPVGLALGLANKLKHPKLIQLWGQTLTGGFNALDSEVQFEYSTGLELAEATALKANYKTFQSLLSTDGASYLGVFLRDDQKSMSLAEKMNAHFAASNLQFEAFPFLDDRIGIFYTGTMNFLNAMSSFFLILVSSVVILSITNSISMSIIERVREIGTLRSFGFTVQRVAQIFAVEYVILTLASLVFGAGLVQIVTVMTNRADILFDPPGVAGSMKFLLYPTLKDSLIFATLIMILVIATSLVVTRKKLKCSVASLLAETTS